MLRGVAAFLCAGLLMLTACGPQEGVRQSVEDFYRGKTITIIVGFSAGGGNDMAARVVAQHWGRFIPGNPRFIVQNMPGAGSFVAAQHIYEVAPKDGSIIGLLIDPAPIAPLLKYTGANYDPHKVGWIGALSKRDSSVVFVRSDAPVKNLEDARRIPIVLGAAGPNGAPAAQARLLNELVGTQFKVIYGYPGGNETMLAVERGEVMGRAATNWLSLKKERPDWIAKGFVRPLVQLTLEPHPDLENVPMAIDFVEDQTDRKVMELSLSVLEFVRIFSVAPGTPPERLAALREAFDEMVRDPDFVAQFKTATSDELNPSDYRAIDAFVTRAYAMPKEVRDRAARYVGND